MSEPRRLLAVHAHPDDESSKGAATMARYVAQGETVMVVSCTGGERGTILNPKLADDPQVRRDLVRVRHTEMARAEAILGVQHTWLGFVDSGLPEGDPLPPLPQGCFALAPLDVATEALVRVIRAFRPHVMTTYDENGGYPHPDHVMCHRVSVAAFRAAGDRQAYLEAGPPWQPLKMYYNHMSFERMRRFHDELVARGLDSPFADWLNRRHRAGVGARPVSTRVPCAEYFAVRNQALLAHATQIDPDGWWFGIPLDIEREVWPTEEFEIAASYIPVPDHEDDLFAGIPDAAEGDTLVERAMTGSAHPVLDVVKEAS